MFIKKIYDPNVMLMDGAECEAIAKDIRLHVTVIEELLTEREVCLATIVDFTGKLVSVLFTSSRCFSLNVFLNVSVHCSQD